MSSVEWNDLDRRIWEEELDAFVPSQIFDVHSHIYQWANYTAPDKETGGYRAFVRPEFEVASWDALNEADRILMPGRTVDRLSFPFPFATHCDFAGSNQFLARQLAGHPRSAGLMLVHPAMTADEVADTVRKYGFVGLKPYRFYARSGDAVECSLTEFLPEHQIEVAHELGLIVMMHLARRDAIGDPENLSDLERLTRQYPNAKWILAHCARSYFSWPIERAGQRLRDLQSVWFDVSSVCESDAIEALMRSVGVERVMYGSDDIPVGVLRGKYISFGRGWAFLSPENHRLNLTHCDPRMTLTRYEQLRAMRQAARRMELQPAEIQKLFCETASELVVAVRRQQSSTK